jgi:hypothetical protein
MTFKKWMEADNFVLKLGDKFHDPHGAAEEAAGEVMGMGHPNPFNEREVIIDGTSVEVLAWHGALILKSIKSAVPKSGAGTRVMQMICKVADKHKVRIELNPEPFGSAKIPRSKLIAFYRGFGFVGDQRKMVREPLSATLP